MGRQSQSHNATMLWSFSSLMLISPRQPMPMTAMFIFSLGARAPPRPSTRAGRNVKPATPAPAASISRRDIVLLSCFTLLVPPNG